LLQREVARMAKAPLHYDNLMHRAGELMAYFGRYDMYALLLERTLMCAPSDGARQRPQNPSSRGEKIGRLIVKRRLPPGIRLEFQAINVEFNASLARNQILARNPAVVARLRLFPDEHTPMFSPSKDWFECAGASADEIAPIMAEFEREIVTLIGLYMRLSGVVHEVRKILGRLH
jgi:hypothetical protein